MSTLVALCIMIAVFHVHYLRRTKWLVCELRYYQSPLSLPVLPLAPVYLRTKVAIQIRYYVVF